LFGAVAVAPLSLASAADLPQIEARGSIRVLAVLERDGGSIAPQRRESPGFDYELIDGFARLRRLRVEIVPIDAWDKLVPALNEGCGDVIAGSFTATDARKQAIDFTAEVMPTRSVVVTRRPRPAVRTLAELRGEKITVFKGTSMAALLLSLGVPASNLDHEVPAEGLSAGLLTGRVTCVVHDVQTAILDQRADPELQLGLFVGPSTSYAFGVRKSDTKLLGSLNEYIANVRRSGTWSRLTVKYFGEAALSILQKARAE
jgi:ABC-type amino acid transport substrate-binding protein